MNAPLALVRPVSPRIGQCQLTHVPRQAIDLHRARRQHARYQQTLEGLGCRVLPLPSAPHLPDSVFVEDTAVVLPELAVIARPGSPARRGETAAVADELARWRERVFMRTPATLDGGDVVVAGERILVGLTARTNRAAVRQLRACLEPRNYRVDAVQVRGCLHLKTAVTALNDHVLLVNPAWCDTRQLRDYRVLTVDRDEPWAANTLRVGDTVVMAAACPATRRRVEQAGFPVRALDAEELAKAEGGLSCCSLIFEP